jgi:hypothetical protein
MLRFFAALLPLRNTTTAIYGAGEAKYFWRLAIGMARLKLIEIDSVTRGCRVWHSARVDGNGL